ncbi:GNAT family N-acetyltransferase [Chloroflexota bacterium]
MAGGLGNIIEVEKHQIKPVADMLARAFQDDPIFVSCIPDADERTGKLPHIYRMNVSYGILYGEVYAVSPALEAVAIWVPPGPTGAWLRRTVRAGGLSVAFRIGWRANRRFAHFNKYFKAMQERNTPERYWYLDMLGVAPVFQGKGCASRLLRPMFDRIDLENLPCYLSTANPNNVPIYQHFGFRLMEQMTVPGMDVTLSAMLRDGSG